MRGLSSKKEKLNDYNTGHSTRITIDLLKIDIEKLISLNKIIRLLKNSFLIRFGKYTFGVWCTMYLILLLLCVIQKQSRSYNLTKQSPNKMSIRNFVPLTKKKKFVIFLLFWSKYSCTHFYFTIHSLTTTNCSHPTFFSFVSFHFPRFPSVDRFDSVGLVITLTQSLNARSRTTDIAITATHGERRRRERSLLVGDG